MGLSDATDRGVQPRRGEYSIWRVDADQMDGGAQILSQRVKIRPWKQIVLVRAESTHCVSIELNKVF
jgi:hypothetical protein